MGFGVEQMSAKAREKMRESCQLAARCLMLVGENIKPGITTDAINTLVHEFIIANGADPSPLGYTGGGGRVPFPKSVCTSVNECVCHGIPSSYVLKDGDIVNVDVTTYLPRRLGYHGDTSVTFYVGEPSADAKLVVETARRSLEVGIAQVRHGAHLGDIGKAIEEYAHSAGCSVVEDYVGHGVGREFHMSPQVPHYYTGEKLRKMKEGWVFTIEPMINLGRKETELQKDQWTVLTKDRSLSAQFEHTVAVTRSGVEVLTTRPGVVLSSEDKDWALLGPLSTPAAWKTLHESSSPEATT